MATRKSTAASSLSHDVHALLHTMREIQRFEEHFCVLLNEIRLKGTVSAQVKKDLLRLLERVPSKQYLDELHAVRRTLEAK